MQESGTPLRPSWRLPWLQLSLLLLLAAGAPARGDATPEPIPPRQSRSELVVGVANDNFPYGFIGPDGKMTGFSSDLLDAVARAMHLRLRRVEASGEGLRQRFAAGEFDLLQGITQTLEREKYATFSVPYLTLQGAIFVRKGEPTIRRLADLDGKRFATTGPDTIGVQFLADQGIRTQLVIVASTEEGLRRVETGEADAVFASGLSALSLIDRDGFRQVVKLDHAIEGHDIRYCFAVHPGDAQLLARLNEGLAILHRTGEFDRVYDKWFGRISGPLVSRRQVVTYGIVALVLAFLGSLWALQRQRLLRRRIATQAAELARQKALLQTLFDHVPIAVSVVEVAGGESRLLAINRPAEPFFNLSAERASGLPLSALAADPEWFGRFTGLLQRGLGASDLLREEVQLAAGGRRLIFSLVPLPPGPAGEQRLCVLMEDVTERRNLDDEIAQSRKLRAIGELVGGIAHEFNNLLTPITLQIGQIQAEWGHDARLLDETRVVADAVKRSAELTQRLLSFGRKTVHRTEQVVLARVVSDCFALLRLTMDRRILWEQVVPPDLPPIYLNATDLNQIILNLVINARDTLMEKLARHPEGWNPVIRIEARMLSSASATPWAEPASSQRQILGWQCLTVRDNGMGIPTAVRERIFEPFFTTKAVGQGTGLGLATVWHLVTGVSGRIEVDSRPGEGTTFQIFLPMVRPPAADAKPPLRTTQSARQARIFLAEDDPLVARTVIAALKRAGHAVTHHTDGAEAWHYLQGALAGYDLFLLDVNMPGMDGLELARRIRAAGGPHCRIIIASGRLGSDDVEELAETKVDRLLNKPFSAAELVEAIRSMLESGPAAG